MPIDPEKCWWFGCWLEPGHYLVNRRDRSVGSECPFHRLENFLDGGYAPRRMREGYWVPLDLDASRICYVNMGTTREQRDRLRYGSNELPQGQALYHQDRGCSLISWWDRTQGDGRGACNSTFIALGTHTATDLLEWFPQVFPAQYQCLVDAGVKLEILPFVGATNDAER